MRHVLGGAGIVDQRVETPPGRRGRGDLPAILVARHVALDHDHLAARAAAEIGGRLRVLLACGIIDHDAPAAPGPDGRGRSPQAPTPTPPGPPQPIPPHPPFLLLFPAAPLPP